MGSRRTAKARLKVYMQSPAPVLYSPTKSPTPASTDTAAAMPTAPKAAPLALHRPPTALEVALADPPIAPITPDAACAPPLERVLTPPA